jgi:hypothetical protein
VHQSSACFDSFFVRAVALLPSKCNKPNTPRKEREKEKRALFSF